MREKGEKPGEVCGPLSNPLPMQVVQEGLSSVLSLACSPLRKSLCFGVALSGHESLYLHVPRLAAAIGHLGAIIMGQLIKQIRVRLEPSKEIPWGLYYLLPQGHVKGNS